MLISSEATVKKTIDNFSNPSAAFANKKEITGIKSALENSNYFIYVDLRKFLYNLKDILQVLAGSFDQENKYYTPYVEPVITLLSYIENISGSAKFDGNGYYSESAINMNTPKELLEKSK